MYTLLKINIWWQNVSHPDITALVDIKLLTYFLKDFFNTVSVFHFQCGYCIVSAWLLYRFSMVSSLQGAYWCLQTTPCCTWTRVSPLMAFPSTASLSSAHHSLCVSRCCCMCRSRPAIQLKTLACLHADLPVCGVIKPVWLLLGLVKQTDLLMCDLPHSNGRLFNVWFATSAWYSCQPAFENVPLVELLYLVFTHVSERSYCGWFRSLLLCLCDVSSFKR